MAKQLRYDIALAAVSLGMVSFVTHLWLFLSYFSSHPGQVHPETGLVHQLNNHGSYVYVSDAESTGLTLLKITFAVGFILSALIVVTKPIQQPIAKAHWAVFWASSAIYLSVIYFLGQPIVNFVLSQGVVL